MRCASRLPMSAHRASAGGKFGSTGYFTARSGWIERSEAKRSPSLRPADVAALNHRTGANSSQAIAASGPIARVDAVEQPQIGRPFGRAAAAVVLLVLGDGLLANVRWDLDQLGACRLHDHLDFGGLDQMLHQAERF